MVGAEYDPHLYGLKWKDPAFSKNFPNLPCYLDRPEVQSETEEQEQEQDQDQEEKQEKVKERERRKQNPKNKIDARELDHKPNQKKEKKGKKRKREQERSLASFQEARQKRAKGHVACIQDTKRTQEDPFSPRRSARIAALPKKPFYVVNEMDMREEEEEEEEGTEGREWIQGTIEQIMLHRSRSDCDDNLQADPGSYEFLVKWKNLSHLHNSWVPFCQLNGHRKLVNYIKGTSTSLSPPSKAVPEELVTIERIIATRSRFTFFFI